VRGFKPTVCFYATSIRPGELGFRKGLIKMVISEFKGRHVHLPTINEQIAGGEAMCADYGEVYRLTHKVFDIVKNAKRVLVSSENGTRIRVRLDPKNLRWNASDGKFGKPGIFSNLPDGEVFTCPLNVYGTFVTNVLGDYFDEKYGLLETPVRIEIKDGFAVSVSCSNKGLEKELWTFLRRGENTDRVGEFAIGTNTAVTRLIGKMLCDEKAAGVHIAFGDPIGDETGATWEVSPAQHCDMVTQGCSIFVDGKAIMRKGKFII
jgi:leucyl aminopeptidase (aminopeptidase T)